MSSRPTIHARDSSGRNISLLNDEPPPKRPVIYRPLIYSASTGEKAAKLHSNSYVSDLSTPSTPSLFRSDSYDSQTTNNDSLSPITPGSMQDLSAQSSYLNVSAYPDPAVYEQRDPHGIFGLYPPKPHPTSSERRSSFVERSSSFDEERHGTERSTAGAKRYPCRYKDTHGCDKTFTTSGHASRHSKIHTAEKAVHCSFPGCHKKFTRADNMKQHLETHYKERSRSSVSSSKSSYPKSSTSSSIKKTSSARTSPQSSRAELRINSAGYGVSYSPSGDHYAAPAYSPVSSPKIAYGALDMGNFDKDLPDRPAVKLEPEMSYTGLDALAAACQVGE